MWQFITETLGWRFLLAFVLSATLWARLTLEQNPERQDVYPSEIPVEVRGLPNTLVVANDMPSVKVRIAAPQESWRSLSVGSFRALVDLSTASPGLLEAPVQVEVSDPEVRILQVIPAKVTLRIEELRTATVPVHVNETGSVPFGFRLVGDPKIDPPNVQVSGPASAVEKVTEAVVTVQMDQVTSTVDRTLKPEPRGTNGVVTGVRLEPQSVTVTVPVEQIAGSKTVSVVPQVRGQPAAGYWVGAITADPPAVQIVAEPKLLNTITVLQTAEVDVSGAQADVVRSVPLLRQAGVSVVPDQPVTVRVSIQPLDGQQVRDLAVGVQNVAAGLTASVTPPTVSVTLAGPQPQLQRLSSDDVTATVDASGLNSGTKALPVTVQAPEGIRVVRVAPDTVTVAVSRASG
jgi:YbbR domain-containing protein